MFKNYKEMCLERKKQGLIPFSEKEWDSAKKEWHLSFYPNRPYSHFRTSNRAYRILFGHRYTAEDTIEDICQLLKIKPESRGCERRKTLNSYILNQIFLKIVELKTNKQNKKNKETK